MGTFVNFSLIYIPIRGLCDFYLFCFFCVFAFGGLLLRLGFVNSLSNKIFSFYYLINPFKTPNQQFSMYLHLAVTRTYTSSAHDRLKIILSP